MKEETSESFLQAIILPGNYIYIGISIVGTKLYANSVLAVYVSFYMPLSALKFLTITSIFLV